MSEFYLGIRKNTHDTQSNSDAFTQRVAVPADACALICNNNKEEVSPRPRS